VTEYEITAAGQFQFKGHIALLDQHLSLLDETCSALDNFQRLNPGWTQQAYRDRLAQIRLRRDRALLPIRSLSGGERLKVALATLTMGPRVADLLLLDEPDNHLDLESQNLLADTLRAYTGTIIMVTHSDAFAEAIGFDEYLTLDQGTPTA
jgi:ATPase subunit of ABC transporter with duplicated ATPase domains